MSGWPGPLARGAALAAGTLLAGLIMQPAMARAAASHALLIGVSKYPEAAHRLLGPPNDVALLWHALRARGVPGDAIRVLAEADELPDPAIRTVSRPTRAAIVAELERLATGVADGDQVFISYSGHGSRQPDASGDEPDGYDEILLPADIGKWVSETAGVENALVDDEIGAFLTRIRTRGAFVWVVMDACHSGTGTRAAGGEYWRTRKVSDGALGVPAAAAAAARQAPAGSKSGSADQVAPLAGGRSGDLVAFFAAQADEPAIESVFPRDYQAADRRPHGMLSFFLAKAMTSHADATYRDLAQHVLAEYDAYVGQAPQPLFEGALDSASMGAEPAGGQAGPANPRRLAVQRPFDGPAVLSAGRLQGITKGMAVRLYGLDGGALAATGRVADVGVAQSTLEIEADDPDALPWRLSAEVDVPPPPLVVARIRDDGAPDLADLNRTLAAELDRMPGMRLVAAGEIADIHLHWLQGRIWLLPPGGEPVSDADRRLPILTATGAPETDARALADMLSAIRRSRSLLGLLAQLGPDALERSLQVTALLLRAPGSKAGERRGCARPPPVDRVASVAEPIDPMAVPQLAQCDTLYVSLRNTGTHPIDITPFYIDVLERAQALPGFQDGHRLEPGATPLVWPLQIATWDPRGRRPLELGTERLLIVGVERPERADLSFVVGLGYLAGAQPPRTRSAGTPPFVRALEELAFPGPRTRSAEQASLQGGGAIVLRWNTRVAATD